MIDRRDWLYSQLLSMSTHVFERRINVNIHIVSLPITCRYCIGSVFLHFQ